ncbi:hypothetical protein apy_10680 [Aeropyrum pernix]|uniref:Uncharacterized protein n=1 Tax=Aeropyrum pernix TaxID=56636 RepID=A0A401HA91_AERPX|nr:hypothetical protein [Aeropyrum pernix]GBF09343.1 hypothetical protein apy_10680 [Aeropyrum pernix]
MRLAFGLLMASLTAALAVAESSAVGVLEYLLPVEEHRVIAKAVLSAVAMAGSFWGLVVASTRFRSPSGRRLVLAVVGVATPAILLGLEGLLGGGVSSLASVMAVSVALGMASFALSSSIYSQVDYVEWRRVLAEYYIVSSVGSSLLIFASLASGRPLIVAGSIAVFALLSAQHVLDMPLSFASLKVVDNFSSAVFSALHGRLDRLRVDEVLRLSSAAGVLAALKIPVIQGASYYLGEATPLVYSLGYALGVTLASTSASTLPASTAALASTLLAMYTGGSLPWLALFIVGLGYGWAVFTLVMHVLDREPKKVRIVTVSVVAWSTAASLAVFAVTSVMGISPYIPALAILVLGLMLSAAARLKNAGVRWE